MYSCMAMWKFWPVNLRHLFQQCPYAKAYSELSHQIFCSQLVKSSLISFCIEFPSYEIKFLELFNFTKTWQLFKIEVLFPIWKKMNDAMFYKVRDIKNLSWYDNLLICLNLYIPMIVQMHKVELYAMHLFLCMEYWRVSLAQ